MPPLEKALAQQRNLLANLTGRLTSDPLTERFELNDLKLPQQLPLSLPSRLVGVAIANQLPQITLAFGVSSQSLSSDTLFGPNLYSSNAGVNILQTVLDGGALATRKKAAQAGLEQADAQYRATVLTAFRNVADTLNALEYDALTLRATVESERAAANSLAIARRRLDLGDTTYVFVLVAELAYQQALLARIQAQAARLTNTAALFQALGGGWWNRSDVTPQAPPRCKPPASPSLVKR